VESFENQSTNQIHETNLMKTLRICHPQYEMNLDLFCKAHIEPLKVRIYDPKNQYESMDLQNKSMFLRISYTSSSQTGGRDPF
jgi:hypothetical protein